MKLNEFFDQVCYINLDKRKDRFKRMEGVLDDNGINAFRVPAIEGNAWNWKADKYPHPMRAFDGVAGGASTQIQILTQAMADGKSSVLILEDDVDFVDNFQQKFDLWSGDVPEDWDILYLGGMNGDGAIFRITEHMYQVTNMMSTHAYAVSEKAYHRVINTMMANFPSLVDSPDGHLRKLQQTLNVYAFNPPMAWQISEYSDIQHGHRDYSEQMKKPLI